MPVGRGKWKQTYVYEVSSIKNVNLSIKYEGIKLQKCFIGCKKGINVVVRFQYSEIGRLENSAYHRKLKTQKKWTPLYIWKKVLNFSNKWLKTANNYLRKVLTLFKKSDNHSTFYSSQQSFILEEKKKKMNWTKIWL